MSPSTSFDLQRNAFGRWVFTPAGGTAVDNVQVVCAFPLTAPQEAISIVGPDGHECAFIAHLDQLGEPQRKAVTAAIEERNFSPVIERIRAVSTFATPSTWQVDTDRGPTELVLKGEEDIRRLPGTRRLLVTGGHGVVFEIRDSSQLDRASRRLLERFL